ncbi:MAG: chorismate-binding protein, partial [Bacteroidota bacterium]|nr:chorismate-binding protein [Bacteroidota bacterium]
MAAKRLECTIEVNDINSFIKKALNFSITFSHCTYFNNNNLPYLYGAFPQMLMMGCHKLIDPNSSDAFEAIKNAHDTEPDWYTGYFGYDLKNICEELKSENLDRIGFPDFLFFQPEHVLIFDNNFVKILSFADPYSLFQSIQDFSVIEDPVQQQEMGKGPSGWQAAMEIEEYLHKTEAIREHIINGDMYEMNYCMEFFAENQQIDPLATYIILNKISPMPFSVFGKFYDKFLLCA